MDDMERERYLKQEKILERAVEEVLALEGEDTGLPVGWVVLVACRTGEDFDAVSHRYLAPQGQPHYVTLGLLLTNLDALRGIGDTTWSDGT